MPTTHTISKGVEFTWTEKLCKSHTPGLYCVIFPTILVVL